MVQVFEYLICDFAIGNSCVAQASAVMQVPGIDKQQIASFLMCPVLHVPYKRVDIPPIRRVRGFLDMTLHPALQLRQTISSELRECLLCV